jgi:hypothetical protein
VTGFVEATYPPFLQDLIGPTAEKYKADRVYVEYLLAEETSADPHPSSADEWNTAWDRVIHRLITKVSPSIRTSAWSELTAGAKHHFKLNDPYVLEFIFSTLATVAMPGDPVWGFVVGPPSGLKTEPLRWLNGLPSVYSTSRLTPHSLVSGLKEGHSLLPLLDGKLLVIKDFTTILEMDRKARDEIISQLRDAYDGYSESYFGSVGLKSFTSHFSVLAAVTSAIESYYAVQSFLGPRFLKVRVPALDGFEQSIVDGGKENEVRRKFSGFAKRVAESIQGDEWKAIDPERVHELRPAAELLALGRTHVSREHDTINQAPEPEMLPRVTKQLRKLVTGRAILYGRSRLDDSDLEFGRRVARDTLPAPRAGLIRALVKSPTTAAILSYEVNLPERTVYRHLQDLEFLGIVVCDDGRPGTFSLPDSPHFFGRYSLSANDVGGDGKGVLRSRLGWLRALGYADSDPKVFEVRRLIGEVQM